MQVVFHFGKHNKRPLLIGPKNNKGKDVIYLNKKLLKLIGGSVLSAMLLVGCGTNDQEPPPPAENNNVETPNDNYDTNGENNVNNNDVNTNNEGDLIEGNQTQKEEVVEDQLNKDKDNR